MKPVKNLVVICLLAASCFSCALMRDTVYAPAEPDARLFQAGEDYYGKKLYKEALSKYQEHLSKFPHSILAPKTLLRMGQIQMEFKNYPKAQTYFYQLIDQYPESSYALDAGIEMLSSYYFTGKYDVVIREADKVSVDSLTMDQLLRFHLTVGNSYLAMKFPRKAYSEFIKAYPNAAPKDMDQVRSCLKSAIALLSSSDIRYELKQSGDGPWAGYLMYQLGLNYLKEGKTDDALSAFELLVKKFPDNEFSGQANHMIRDMKAPAPKEEKPQDLKTIGCLLPLSGKYEAFGQKALKGVELALTVFARDQGIESLKILIKDTASEPAKAEQSIRELADNHAIAVIGPVAASEEAVAEAQRLKVPIITLTQKSNITDAGDYVFRNFLTPEMQVKTLISYAMGTLNVSRFAVLYPDESYGNTFKKLFVDEAVKSGASIAGAVAYNPVLTDFADPIKKLINENYPASLDDQHKTSEINPSAPAEAADMEEKVSGNHENESRSEIHFDAVFIPDSPDKAGLIIPQLSYYGIRNIYLLGTNLWHSEKMIQITASQIQGAIIPDGFFESSASENVSRFVGEFEKTYGYTPGFMEAVSYDTAMILFNLALQPDVRSPDEMKEKLLTMPPFPGVTGATSFAPNGDAVKDLYLLKVIAGKFKEIYYK